MSLIDWFAARRKDQFVGKVSQDPEESDGLWVKCSECGQVAYRKDLISNFNVCSNCGHHNRINSDERINIIADKDSFKEFDESLSPTDPLKFKDRRSYSERIKESQKGTGLKDGVITGLCSVNSMPLALAVMDFRFMGGSMGQYVGEAFKIGCQKAIELQCPFISISSSGGARMQEGLISLMQLPKTVAAVNLLDKERIPFISLLTHPTTGGVSASFAMLGDIIIAEKGSMIGFAGKRVIEKTINEQLPEDFQTAEYLLDHGMIDMVVHRKELRDTLSRVVSFVKK